MKEPTSLFGIALRAWRRDAKATGAQLGAQLGVKHATISQLEVGRLKPSDTVLEKLKALGFTYEFSPGERKLKISGEEQVQFTEAELNLRPYANDPITIREYHTTSYQLAKDHGPADEFVVPTFGKTSYFVEAFCWFRDTRVSYNTFVGQELAAELDAPVKAAAEAFYGQLLADWNQVPQWQRGAIQVAAADSLRADEVWLANRNCSVRRADKGTVSAPLTNLARRTFQTLYGLPNAYQELHPSLVPPGLRPASRITQQAAG